jgi:hypothetical protein
MNVFSRTKLLRLTNVRSLRYSATAASKEQTSDSRGKRTSAIADLLRSISKDASAVTHADIVMHVTAALSSAKSVATSLRLIEAFESAKQCRPIQSALLRKPVLKHLLEDIHGNALRIVGVFEGLDSSGLKVLQAELTDFVVGLVAADRETSDRDSIAVLATLAIVRKALHAGATLSDVAMRSVVAYLAIDASTLDEAIELCRRCVTAKPRVDIDDTTIAAVVKSLALLRTPRDAFAFVYDMRRNGVRIEAACVAELVELCVNRLDDVERALTLCEQARSVGVAPLARTYDLLIRTLCAAKRDATALSDTMRQEGLALGAEACAALIAFDCARGRPDRAVEHVADMLRRELPLESSSVAQIVHARLQNGQARVAQRFVSITARVPSARRALRSGIVLLALHLARTSYSHALEFLDELAHIGVDIKVKNPNFVSFELIMLMCAAVVVFVLLCSTQC